jgi:hypothetical protein
VLATLHAQDVGFANAWPELTPQDREHVMRYAEDFKSFLGKALLAADVQIVHVGVGLLSMHSPSEVSSKVDLWHLTVGSSRSSISKEPGLRNQDSGLGQFGVFRVWDAGLAGTCCF